MGRTALARGTANAISVWATSANSGMPGEGRQLPTAATISKQVMLMHTDIAMKRLAAIPGVTKSGKRINGLFRLMTCRDLWIEAYNRIATNRGSMTPGSDGETFDGISLEKIDALATRVLEGTYEPTPARRVYIPKSNGKLRPLGIPSVSDRLVQEVARSILDTVYEPNFSDQSHGFRAGRSCHTALEHIKAAWTGSKWFVEVDIVGYFDNIDHKVLMDLLAKRIDDKRFLRLINSFLKAGYLEQWRFHNTYSGTPQGGIISPLLANIYLHELDKFMAGWIKDRNKGAARIPHPEWETRTKRLQRVRKKIRDINSAPLPGDATDATIWDTDVARLEAEIARLMAERLAYPCGYPLDPGYRRYRYVRYADDFLIGVIGSKADAEEVMDAVRMFLTGLKLEVSETKSAVRHASEGVIFLGYDIHTWTPKRSKVIRDSIGRNYTKRASGDHITLNVPRAKILAFCNSQEYGDLNTLWPLHRPGLALSSEYEIASQYNAEIRGFAQYYALAGNVKASLSPLQLIGMGSLLKTIANKRRTSMWRVIRQMRGNDGAWYATSRDMEGKARSVRVWRLKDLVKPKPANLNLDIAAHRFNHAWNRTDLVDRLFAQGCSNCGSTETSIEIHHVHKLADHKGSSFMEFIKAARTRKRIPLCVACHHNLHSGNLADYRTRMKQEAESRVQ